MPAPVLDKSLALLRMVKIEHSIFALPFAYLGAFLAARGWPGFGPFLLLTLAMVAVRSFAMGFNRVVDLRFDRENPRTQNRPLVTGELSQTEAVIFLVVTALVFVLACAALNMVCLMLAPLALGVTAFYSFTKRFTWLCHFVLGAALGLAPIAGWLAVRPSFDVAWGLFFCGVLFWAAGFDILYACQDAEFDQDHDLHSLPADKGLPAALTLSSFCHVNTALFFFLAGWAAHLAWPYYLAWAVVSGVLCWEHRLIAPDDLSRVNMAFFTLNGAVSAALFLGALAALAL